MAVLVLVLALALRWVWDKGSLWIRGLGAGLVRSFLTAPHRALGIITLSVSDDEGGGLDSQIRASLGKFGLKGLLPREDTSIQIAAAVTEAAPTGTAIATAIPKLWVQLKPGRLHRVVVSVLLTMRNPNME